jgi:hypothetical protein
MAMEHPSDTTIANSGAAAVIFPLAAIVFNCRIKNALGPPFVSDTKVSRGAISVNLFCSVQRSIIVATVMGLSLLLGLRVGDLRIADSFWVLVYHL